jgi:hypothetical protein
MPDDRDLRELFAELRREDHAHAGEFGSFLRARPRANPIRLSVWAAAAAGLAVTIAVVVMSVPRSGRRTIGTPEISITEWKSSTDFLLRTPGLELLRTIPSIGEWPASAGIKGGRRKSPANRPATRKKSLTKTSFEEYAQNGARREPVLDSPCGTRRALCALEKLAQNGARREPVPDSPCGARRALCALEEHLS